MAHPHGADSAYGDRMGGGGASVVVFGHGGDEPGHPLNSLASFVAVRASGAHGVELDVRRTADDHIVAIHDHTLPDGRPVASTPRAQLPPDIATLHEVLDVCAAMTVNIEVKNFPSDPAFDPDERITDLVVDVVRGRGMTDAVIVSSFGMGSIDRVLAHHPELRTAALVLSRRPPEVILDRVVAHGHRIVHPYDTMVTEAFMSCARARSLAVNVWLDEDESVARMRQLVDLGVDGIITSHPERVLSITEGA